MDTVSSRGWEGHGYVKAVPSGDRLVIMAKTKSRSGPPPEITLILDFIAAPKLAIRDGVSEPYAWYSREFLRNLLIGQPIKFRVDRKIEGTTRNFGTAFTSDGQDVTEIVVSEGWASVKESPSYLRGDDTTRARLLRLEIAAKSGHLGMWSKSRSSRMPERRKISIVSDARKLFQEVQNKDLDAIVEYVRDGSSYRIVLVDYMVSIVFNLVGVSCPRLGRKTKEGEIMSTPEPYALEAKHFVEVRLLHRRIPVRLKMINKSGDMFMGEIVHPKGDIGMEILKRGLGRVLDWSLTYCSDHTLYVLEVVVFLFEINNSLAHHYDFKPYTHT
jgi:staphylococcal nuclease domain-containing protein 1